MLGIAHVSRNYLKNSHRYFTAILIFSDSLWDTIVAVYEIIKSKIKLYILGLSSFRGKARVRLWHSLSLTLRLGW